MSYASAILADSPVRYWRLGDTSGTTMVDATGNIDGTYSNSPTLNEASLLPNGEGKSVRFTAASSQYASVTDSVSTRYRTFTIECWVKQVTNGQQNIIQAYAATSSGNNQRTNNVLFGSSGGNDGHFLAGTIINQGGLSNAEVGAAITQGSLQYVVFTVAYNSGANSTDLALYLNCSQVSTLTGTSYAPDNTTATVWSIAKDLGLGGTWAQGYLDGWLQELAIYNYEMSSTQMNNHCDAAQPQPSYTGAWGVR